MVARGENCFASVACDGFPSAPTSSLMSFAAHHSPVGRAGRRPHPHAVEEKREGRRLSDLPGVREGTLGNHRLLTTAQ